MDRKHSWVTIHAEVDENEKVTEHWSWCSFCGTMSHQGPGRLKEYWRRGVSYGEGESLPIGQKEAPECRR